MLPRGQGDSGGIAKWTACPGKETPGIRATRGESLVRQEKWLAGKCMTYSEGRNLGSPSWESLEDTHKWPSE